MIFSELYSVYYSTVGKIIDSIQMGNGDERTLRKIVEENAFGESVLTILPSLKSGKWKLVRKDFTTTLEHCPEMPMTDIQKRWLKSISLDKRIKLFGLEFQGLEEVEPLFTNEDFRIYDRYTDGDDFEDAGYIERFRTILGAIKEKKPIKLEYIDRKGNSSFIKCLPIRLEYSQKDDKFRLISSGCRFAAVKNLSRVTSCSLCEENLRLDNSESKPVTDTVTLEITDDKNCLERAMFHFAHLEKRTEKIDQKKYLLTLYYDRNDASEMVIRILSFGPRIKVVSPDSFIELIKEKLIQQKKLLK